MAQTNTQEFVLDYPISFNGETVSSVTLRRPKGREIRNMGNGPGSNLDRSFALIATLADRETELFDEMDGGDFTKISNWLNKILGE